jgi:hypothetical protein
MRVISTAVVALVIAGAAAASPAKDGGGPPKIDIEKTCRENVGALSTTLGSEIRQDTNICMTDERDARDQLVKNWSRYPALAKEQCVKPQEYLPGYVEWLSCIEMTRDARQARKDQSSPTTSGMGSSRRASTRRADTPST